MTELGQNELLPEEYPVKRKSYIVATYDQSMAYGGPEEGGWWYDAGTLVRIHKTFRNMDKAYAYARRMNRTLKNRNWGPNAGKHSYSSVLSEGMIFARVYEDFAPKVFPEVRPHYE